MDQPEFTINRNPSAADVAEAIAAATPGGAGVGSSEAADRANKLRAQARAERAAGKFSGLDSTDTDEADEAPPREDCESVEIELPDGRVVDFGPPPGVSITMRMMTTFQGVQMTSAQSYAMRALMYVRTVEGKAPRSIGNMVDVQMLANQLGDVALDLLVEAILQYWPPPAKADLKVIQKKMRSS